MDFSSAVQWWGEWQLRILVLGSLFVQYFLFFSTMVRGCVPSWFRVFVWLGYLAGDALAIYSLATLFNRHKQVAAMDGSGVLEALWAPVLLIHLGGQHPMTAYSIEDNELWRRHVVTMVSQITIALYVFCKSWSGQKRLLQAAILLFVVGIIKFSQKPWALKNASVNSMVTSSSLSARRVPSFLACCSFFTSFAPYFTSIEKRMKEEKEEEHDLSLQEFVENARNCVQETKFASDQEQMKFVSDQMDRFDEHHYFRRLFVDISPPYSRRLISLQLLMGFGGQRVFRQLEHELGRTFGTIYTKQMVLFSVLGFYLNFLLPFLTLASVLLFSTSHKDGYKASDVKVTYILFCCTAVLDLLSMFIGPCIALAGLPFSQVYKSSLLSTCARKKRPTVLMNIASVVCCKNYVNMHWYIEQLTLDDEITELVLGYVKDGWKGYIRDAASYRRFNSHRGQWTLRRHRLGRDNRLGWSLNMPFDRSVLLWHIATDLCFHHQSTSPHGQACAARSRVISNYMAYLLFIRPEMLMPGTRKGIFTVACDDVELMLAGETVLDETGLAHGIFRRAQQSPGRQNDDIGTLVPNACRLAKALMELPGEEKRWVVVEGVWVEMLCYSAGRCRGYLHAKSLGEGPELLTYVWLLLSFMGMETFADRFQRPEPPEAKEQEDDDEEGEYPTASEGRAAEDETAANSV